MNTVTVNAKAAARIDSGHVWIFRSDVLDTGSAKPGEAVLVKNARRTLGTAHFSAASQITLRMLAARVEEPDRTFFRNRLAQAAEHRARVVTDSNAFRLVHAEADGLPALIVDRYEDYLVLQALNQGMEAATAFIVEALQELFHPKGVLARNDGPVRVQEALPRECKVLAGDIPAAVPIRMNGFTLQADLAHGMKTGVFLDQRENYLAAQHYARGAALDCFTSTGGFALHLARKSDHVIALDSSEPALAIAKANAAANGITNIEWRAADVFEALGGFYSAHRSFDTIVLDPPAFAKSRGHLDAARRAYKQLNRRAISLLAPRGTLITCSCSHHMSEADLFGIVAEAAVETHRTLRVLERRTQASDHPILLTVPETHYLKCLIFESTVW